MSTMNTTTTVITSSPVRILLSGFGHVAQAFLPLLASRREWIGSEFGLYPLICGISTRSQGYYLHAEGVDVGVLAQAEHPLRWFHAQSQRMSDADAFIKQGKAAGASVLIELTTLNPRDGQPALQYIRCALQSGMNVITANKGPVAYAGAELQALARHTNVQFRYESTVMDGLPLINLTEYTLPAVEIHAFRAILNTTSSLVLHLIEQGSIMEEAIGQAQQLGIAEADPWYDLDGWDAAMKTTILANMFFPVQITPSMVQRSGLRNIARDDILTAAAAGTPLRLVSSARYRNGAVIAEVAPQPIARDDMLHVATGTTSVISLDTEAMGTITLVEHEPKVIQTAYGVFSDLINILKTRN